MSHFVIGAFPPPMNAEVPIFQRLEPFAPPVWRVIFQGLARSLMVATFPLSANDFGRQRRSQANFT